jgi:two-component system KDP operon response regulator KdpE
VTTSPRDAAHAPILVVEDEPELCAVVRFILEDEGYTVVTASDGQEALDRVAEKRPRLILLDMGLPVLNGEEVAAGISELLVEPPPILVMSAAGNVAERARRIGAASFIAKPFDLDDLAAAVRDVLDGKSAAL